MNIGAIIERKSDTVAKLAAAAGKPTKNFLFANEINKIADILRIFTAVTPINNQVIAANLKKELGTITGSFIDYINIHAPSYYIPPTFVIYTEAGITYTQAFVGIAGTYGTGQLQVTAEMFVLVEQSDAPPTVLPETKIFKGLISSNQIFTKSNRLGYEVTSALVDGYVVTNIPFSIGTQPFIYEPYTFRPDFGDYYKVGYFDIGGYLAFKQQWFQVSGDTVDGFEISHVPFQVEVYN